MAIHFLLSDYGQSLIDLFEDTIITKEEAKDEALNDINNGHIDEIEYNIIIRHLETNKI